MKVKKPRFRLVPPPKDLDDHRLLEFVGRGLQPFDVWGKRLVPQDLINKVWKEGLYSGDMYTEQGYMDYGRVKWEHERYGKISLKQHKRLTWKRFLTTFEKSLYQICDIETLITFLSAAFYQDKILAWFLQPDQEITHESRDMKVKTKRDEVPEHEKVASLDELIYRYGKPLDALWKMTWRHFGKQGIQGAELGKIEKVALDCFDDSPDAYEPIKRDMIDGPTDLFILVSSQEPRSFIGNLLQRALLIDHHIQIGSRAAFKRFSQMKKPLR